MLKHLLVGLMMGLVVYWVATLHIAAWIIIAIVCPATLLFIHFVFKPVFTRIFRERKLIFFKYVTFLVQNILLIICYFYLPEAYLGILCTWAIRLNIFEVMVDLFQAKRYILLIPSVFMLFGTNLEFAKDPVHIVTITNSSIFFIIEYTLWFIAWIATCAPKRFGAILHTIYPLFFAPHLWVSVRTLTGMFALEYSYIPGSDQIVNTDKKEVSIFAKYYVPVYLVLWSALYIYRFFYS